VSGRGGGASCAIAAAHTGSGAGRWQYVLPCAAEALQGMSEQDTRELLEDLADAAAAREALAEPGESVPWEQVRAEAGL
jgi:hypothetical protein